MPHSKGIIIDPLISITSVMFSVALDFVRNIGSNDISDISVGKSIDSKYNLILEIGKSSLIDKFDFKVIRSTSTSFETHYTSISCKMMS